MCTEHGVAEAVARSLPRCGSWTLLAEACLTAVVCALIRGYPTLFSAAGRLAAFSTGRWTTHGRTRSLLCRYIDRIAKLGLNAH